ncbi:hypothetical protein UFOVP815_34 [uncultured Caudovirales phage]|uniref:Uncharacterized protein n=1 Tax=uncultured Caudovirales phage TaxID=2100421 RepID=A0A6J5P7Z8_9CAUD|nr:hypothetical protein UFOVP815_34 [uncultured Caudovirales phage]
MVFNGHTQDSIAELDEVTIAQIQTMYADGALGTQKTNYLLSVLIAGVFNYMRPSGKTPYETKQPMGAAYEYIFPPASEEDQKAQVNSTLLSFMMQAPGFNVTTFGAANGE